MAHNLVQLEISFASGGVDESAKLCWKNDAGAEQEYAVVQLRATVQQETFPGHRWVLRGQQSGNVLWEGVAAAAPAVQAHIVHVRARAGDDEAAAAGGEAAEAGGEGAAVGADASAVDGAAEPIGVWKSEDGLHTFERLPGVGRDGEVLWRQVDSVGREVARLEQLETRVDTRWLWWTDAILLRVAPHVTGEREHLIWCALTIAAAYNLDSQIPWPPALRAAAARIGPQPAALLCVLFFLAMAMVAAALPLRSTTLLLYNNAERNELRLGDTRGSARPPSTRPGYQNAWSHVCVGGFTKLPPDLVKLQSQRGFHGAFCLGAAAAIAAAGLKGLGMR